MATYFCYEKVHRRTTRTAIVSYLLKTVTLFRLISTAWNVQIRSFCWSVFSRIRTEYGKIRSISPYSVQMRENTPYLSVFSSNAGKYGPEKTPICTLFKQWRDRFQISAASLTLISEWAPPSNKYLPSNKCHISKRSRYQKSDNNLTVTSWKWKWNKCTNYEKK